MRAADALAVKGLSVCVLEARDRVGGRTCLDETPEGIVVDVGGQWISTRALCVRRPAGVWGLTHTVADTVCGGLSLLLDGRLDSAAVY